MKHKLLISAISLFMLFAQDLYAQAVFRGKVIDDQNLSLPGANIILEGTNKGSVSNQLGDFFIQGIPAGNYTAIVTYLGYISLTKEISLQDGQTLDLRFIMMPGTLESGEVIVFGDRLKGQARALNQQKTNSNITNIVAADQIGRFPDANIGDAMKRIPGITMQNDQGEARDIIIRGMAPELNSVMING